MSRLKKTSTLKREIVSISVLLLCLLTMSLYSYHSLEDRETPKSQENFLPQKERILVSMSEIPLYFEKNEGQMDSTVKYLTKGEGYAFYFTPRSIVISFQKTEECRVSLSSLKIEFVGTAQQPFIRGIEEQIYKTHYFIGNEPSQWHTNVPNFAKVRYEELYPGIDAVFYGNQQRLEYDLCVAPGRNPHEIRLHIEGIKKLSLDTAGNLRIHAEDGQEILMYKPIVYQMLEGKKNFLEGNFALLASDEVGFALGDYDQTKELIIDPMLEYSTYLGGVGSTFATQMAVDDSGNAYVTGGTNSTNFPTITGAFQTAFTGVLDLFVTKINSTGSGLIYSTYLGGSNDDQANGIAIDSLGNAYITGFTNSSNYPITIGAFKTFLSGATDAFVTRLNSAGSALLYSTYLGGSSNEKGFGIAVDSDQSAYIGGFTSSSNFPTTLGVFQQTLNGTGCAFVTKFDLFGNLLYSTYFGGSNNQEALSIAIDNNHSAYITGFTTSTNLPTTSNAFQLTYGGGTRNAFLTKFNSSATAITYSTYLGGNGFDQGNYIALDNANHAYVVGSTSSSNFPVTAGAFQTSFTASTVGFLTKIDVSQTPLVYSTLLGGTSGSTQGMGVAVDNQENAYITGSTSSNNFPTTIDAFQNSLAGSSNAFITEFNSAGSGLIYSTYLGGNSTTNTGTGIVLDTNNNFYVTGQTNASNFPTTTGAFQTVLTGTTDAFITKFQIPTSTVTDIFPFFGPTTGGTSVTIIGTNFFGVLSVHFGGTPAASFIVDSPTQITAISPPGLGIVDVTVTTPNGTSAISLADEFTYVQSQQATSTTLTVSTPSAQSVITLTATINPSLAIGIVTFFDNGNAIGTVSLMNGTAILSTILSPGTHVLSAIYHGNINLLPSSASTTIVISSPPIPPAPPTPPLPFPPAELKGVKKPNQFTTQVDIVNILTWKAPTQGNVPISYRIYRNQELTQLIGVVPSHKKLQFADHNRKKRKTYTYWIVSVDNAGNISKPAIVTVHD